MNKFKFKFKGSIIWVGDYSECIQIREPYWNGKYCKLTDKIQFGMCLPKTCTETDVVHLVNFGKFLMDYILSNK